MSTNGKNILTKFLKRWQFLLVLEILFYAIGMFLFVLFATQSIVLSLFIFMLSIIISSFFIKPWKINLKSTSSYLDSQIDTLEYSTGLLLKPWEHHSNLSKLQYVKVSKQLKHAVKKITPPNRIIRSAIISILLILIGIICYQLNLRDYLKISNSPITTENAIIFRTKDSSKLKIKPPKIIEQLVTVSFPKYTNKKPYTTTNMDLKVLEGSQVFWKLQFDSKVDSVLMESMGNHYPMSLKNNFYKKSKTLNSAGFYNFKFLDTLNNQYTSDLFAINLFKDQSPEIKTEDLKQFTSFSYDDDKTIKFNNLITDDFGISDAYIIATVSKGSGESVKFREEKIRFDNTITKGSTSISLSKKINLDSLKMKPGDELYFYIEAHDFKTPQQNISRSETYFAVIKDTTSYDFAVESNLGVNRMPDYFRSQRQLIIDTEKLIKEKSQLTVENFKSRSNALGFDQKTLRLKYGEFMGVESESGLDIETEANSGHEEAQDEDHDDDDPLAEYTHDHDGANEHNLVATKKEGKNSKNPLEEFMHDHGDPEMASLFGKSLKAKMHKAMSEMWDAELYLRLYEPQKSLTYQYKALELIQDIKNHARIYVHRIGFDPPPIKEDKRLTGKQLDKINSYRKNETLKKESEIKNIKLAITRLGKLIDNKSPISKKDKLLFENAASELSLLAIKNPTQHLNTLQLMKHVIEETDTSFISFKKLQDGLLISLPNTTSTPKKNNIFIHEIDKLLLKDLSIND